jgi:porin
MTPDPLTDAYKIGFWYDSEGFADLRFDTTGAPLASPASNGLPMFHRGNYAFYVADQMVYRWQDDPDRTINVFVRPMFTPLQDRNLVSFSLNAGVTMHEPIVERKMRPCRRRPGPPLGEAAKQIAIRRSRARRR